MKELPMNKKFYCFSSCIMVNGASQSIIYDIQRKSYEYIPNILYDIAHEFNGKMIQDVIDNYGVENKDIIIEYFDFLLENEYIFFSDFGIESFPKMDLTWHSPFEISTLIIDISKETFPLLQKIYDEVEMLGCGAISFRFLDAELFKSSFKEVLAIFSRSRCRSFEIFIPFDIEKGEDYFNEITIKNNRIYSIHVYDAIESKVIILDKIKTPLFYHTESLEPNTSHVVNVGNFVVNMQMFTESQQHNTFFNRKIYINGNGAIQNAPNCDKIFGSVQKDSLAEMLTNDDFTKYWNIKKDIIKVCKDCEYRHMCVDARKPLQKNTEGLWELEGICAYDPYETTWA